MSLTAAQLDTVLSVVRTGTFRREDIITALYRASVPIGDLETEADAFLEDQASQGLIQPLPEIDMDLWQKL